MKRLLLPLISIALLNCAWTSETGGGVVSQQANVVVTSMEATQVLQGDTLNLLYGETRLGGATNGASFDSGGVFSLRNVASSSNKVLLNNNDMLSWLTVNGQTKNVGLNNADVFRLPRTTVSGWVSADAATITSLNVTTVTGINSLNLSGGLSADTLHVVGKLDVSGDTIVTDISATDASVNTLNVSGVTNLVTANITTGTVDTLNSTTGTITSGSFTRAYFGSNATVIDQNGKIIYQTNRPKRTIYLTGGGANAITAAQSADTIGLGGASPIYKPVTLKYSPTADQEAQWNFIIPDSYIGTSVNGQVVWYEKDLDTGDVSFEVTTVGVPDGVSFNTATVSASGKINDTFIASGDIMVTSSFSIPTSWVSGDMAVVRLIRKSSDAGDTTSHDVNVVGLKLEYDAQTDSD